MNITFANFKGGVGKTTTTALFSYLLSKEYKVLSIDTDPQSNLTETLALTYGKEIDQDKNLFNALFYEENIEHNIQSLSDNLDILAGSWSMVEFEKEARDLYYKKDLEKILKMNLMNINDKYDYILIDTAPTTNLVMDNAVMASDQIVVTTQTVPMAYESTQKYYNYLLDRYHDDNYNFELLGVLPYLVGNSATDIELLNKYKKVFYEELFENSIRQSDRVKTWSRNGITTNKPYDKVTLKMYQNVVLEALKKMKGK